MKFCNRCGAQMPDQANFCPVCGLNVQPQGANYYYPQPDSGLRTAAKVFMILGCILSAFYFLIPLCWTIPMTVHYCNRTKAGLPVGTGFKVCSLLFVSLIGGILMLCDKNP